MRERARGSRSPASDGTFRTHGRRPVGKHLLHNNLTTDKQGKYAESRDGMAVAAGLDAPGEH
jgi:hypothetical protein